MRLAFIAALTAIVCCYAHGIAFSIPLMQRNNSATVHIKHTGETRRFIVYQANGQKDIMETFVKCGGYSYLAW